PSPPGSLTGQAEARANVFAGLGVLDPQVTTAQAAGKKNAVRLRKRRAQVLMGHTRHAFGPCGADAPDQAGVVHLGRVRLPSVAAPYEVAQPQHADAVEVESAHGVGTADFAQGIGVHRAAVRRLDEPGVVAPVAGYEVPDLAPVAPRSRLILVRFVKVLLRRREHVRMRRAFRLPLARIACEQPHGTTAGRLFPKLLLEFGR